MPKPANDNPDRTPAQKADPAFWRPGDALMLACEARDGYGNPHPGAGRIGLIRDIGPRRGPDELVSVEIGTDESRTVFLLLPLRMFHPVPAFCIEAFTPRPGRRAWRLSAEGQRIFKTMQWPSTTESVLPWTT
jgi:hypothetical protein